MNRKILFLSIGKKNFYRWLIAILIIILIILLPIIFWLVKAEDTLSTLLYTKTVPDTSYRQHIHSMWFLKHTKGLTPEGLRFSTSTTYRGYHPEKQENERIIPLYPIPDNTDIVYITDTYGIYRGGAGFSRTGEEGIRNLIYGGTTLEDLASLSEFLNRETPHTVIAEYNTFGTPTIAYVQKRLYELFRTRWTGWAGQYVHDLSEKGDAPPWIFDAYSENTGTRWEYRGSGFIFYNLEDEVVVLTMGDDVGPKGNQLSLTELGTEQLGVIDSVYYNLIFDIVEPLLHGEVLAHYNLDVTDVGREKLEKWGIPSQFPAIISSSYAHQKTYYFAGNWADNPHPLRFHFLAGLPKLMKHSVRNSLKSEHAFMWKFYMPVMEALYQEARERKTSYLPTTISKNTYHEDGVQMISRTQNPHLQIFEHGMWKDFFIYGVNLGTALPGRWFTEFPANKALYFRYLQSMGEMGLNTVRIYTLLDPHFYQAFLLYNTLHPEKPLWLLQEIWPEEEPPNDDYLAPDYVSAYEQEIRYVIDAIHGNASIEERRGRAWGVYDADVSQFLLGYLVGRELEPHEVEATDALHQGYSFTGEYFSTHPQASPTEGWLTSCLDYVMAYQEQQYRWQHPVAIVNWPTLDPLYHESERDEFGNKEREYNDRTTVDINHIITEKRTKAGLFGAYHIYPNYPDFMNNEREFATYYDELGRFMYGGYLRKFIDIHRQYPAVIAEFGIATGMGNAHTNPDGYHHGSLTEEEQGYGIIRMFETMKREGYAGGVIFAWMDEWAKKTWTTEPFMIPYDRQVLWHNAIDPEQNYGILAYEAIRPSRAGARTLGDGEIAHMSLRMDPSFLHIDIVLEKPIDFDSHTLLIGIDTYARERGELLYDQALDVQAPSGMEYLIRLENLQTGKLLVIPPYNYASARHSSYEHLMRTGVFEPMVKLINRARSYPDGTPIEALFEEASLLRYGNFVGNTHHWLVTTNTIQVRIPWTRIHVSDPSSAQVIDDSGSYNLLERDQLKTTTSESIVVSALLIQKEDFSVAGSCGLNPQDMLSLNWRPWNEPEYSQRLKESYHILANYFSTIHKEGR